MSPERDERGQFSPGNSGGPGRPRLRTERAYLATMRDAVSVDAWREIVERAVDDARGGDARARAWLSEHLVGRMEPGADPLHRLAVEEVADSDPVGQEAARLRQDDRLNDLLIGR